MNEQTDKIKICDIIADCFTKEENFTWNGRLVPKLANALIAAGIGDVIEVEMAANRYEMLYSMQARDMALAERRAHDAEHRAARAERALRDELVQKAIRLGVIDIRPWYIQALNEAEKKIAAEGKDD